jgi:hypothetical protein
MWQKRVVTALVTLGLRTAARPSKSRHGVPNVRRVVNEMEVKAKYFFPSVVSVGSVLR